MPQDGTVRSMVGRRASGRRSPHPRACLESHVSANCVSLVHKVSSNGRQASAAERATNVLFMRTFVMSHNSEAIAGFLHELDRLVFKKNAAVSIAADDSGGCRLVGNESGYLRLGIELMKATLAAPAPDATGDPVPMELDLGYLADGTSSARLHALLRRAEHSADSQSRQQRFQSIFQIAFMAILGLVAVALAAGMVGMAMWFSLL